MLILLPEGTRNYCQNPSFGYNLDGYAAVTGASLARDLSRSRFGRASCRVTPPGAVPNEGIEYNVDLSLANEPVAFSVYVRGSGRVFIEAEANDNAQRISTDPILLNDEFWQRITVIINLGGVVETDLDLRVLTYEAQAQVFYVDGFQIENKGYSTTYVDGDMEIEFPPHEGYPFVYWVGQRHASDSIRSDRFRLGGRWRDLSQGLNTNLWPIDVSGYGLPPVQLGVQSYAGQEIANVQNIRALPRSVALNFYAVRSPELRTKGCPDSLEALHDARRTLVEAVKPDAKGAMQSFMLRYNEGDVPMDLEAYYEGGMEWDGDIRNPYENNFSIRLFCPDPYWRADSQDCVELEANATPAIDHAYLIAKEDGEWEGFGSANFPIRVIKVHPNGDIYIGGDFTNIGAVAANHVARYDGENWNALASNPAWVGTGTTVNDITFGPDGMVYFGGAFTSIGGTSMNNLTRYDPTTDTFHRLGGAANPGVNGPVFALTCAANGRVYFGGSMTQTTAGTTLNYLGHYTRGTDTFDNMGAQPGLDAFVHAMEMDLDGATVFIGGDFTQENGKFDGALPYICEYDPDADAYSAMAESSMDDSVYTLKMAIDGKLYLGGKFTSAGFWDAEKIAMWNRNDFYPLGSNGDGMVGGTQVNYIEIDRRGLIYIGGDFTSATNSDLAAYLATWDGSRFSHTDSVVGAEVEAIASRFEDLFIGYLGASVTTTADVQTITNNGEAKGSPFLDVRGPIHLRWLENQEDGARIRLDLDVQSFERVLIDLRPGKFKAESEFRGNVISGVLANSDFSKFKLNPGDNRISFLGTGDDGNTEVSLRWRVTNWSFDDIVG
jgi:hypothetical protein